VPNTISRLSHEGNVQRLEYTNISVGVGFSGGPVFDQYGKCHRHARCSECGWRELRSRSRSTPRYRRLKRLITRFQRLFPSACRRRLRLLWRNPYRHLRQQGPRSVPISSCIRLRCYLAILMRWKRPPERFKSYIRGNVAFASASASRDIEVNGICSRSSCQFAESVPDGKRESPGEGI
jgi:hypothetical protein